MNMLTHLSTLEISNVKKAANRKRYAITKSEKKMSVDTKQVVTVVAEGETEFVETLKSEGASEDRIAAEVAIYRIKKNCADVLPKVAKAHKEPDGDEQGADESDDAYMKRAKKCGFEPKKKTAKSADSQEPEMDAKVEAMFKSMNEKLETVEKSNRELTDRNRKLEYITKAEKEFPYAPGSTEENAMLLKSAHDAGPKAEEAMLANLKRMSEFVQKNQTIMQASGVAGGATGHGDAEAKMQALAKSITMKSEDGRPLTDAQRMVQVMKTAEGRELYNQYLAENPKQHA